MKIYKLRLLFLALIYSGIYHVVYIDYLHLVFRYADFRYEPTTLGYIVWTYLIAVLPVIIVQKSNKPSNVGCALIYTLSYIPIQFTLTFMWADKNIELMLVQCLLMISMGTLFKLSFSRSYKGRYKHLELNAFLKLSPLNLAIHFLTLLGLILMIAQHYSIMRFVSFEDVYVLRSEAEKIQTNLLTNYMVMWLTYCFGPFYIAKALTKGSILDWFFGLVIFLLVYSATASKLAVITPFIMFAMKHIGIDRKNFFERLLFVLILIIGSILVFIPNDGILSWVSSIFLMRSLGSNGWVAAVYYEYFSSHEFTFYSHIGPINGLFSNYPYGENSLGQEIAQYYFGNDANFNAGFWASDGFAALGMVGIPVITIFLVIFIRMFDKLSIQYPTQFINYWMLGFWMILMNAPFTTALLSGGGLLIALLLWFALPTRQSKVSDNAVVDFS